MKESQVNTEIIKIVFKKRKNIAFGTLCFGFLMCIITFFIPKTYTSTGIVYPTSSNNIKDVAQSTFFGYEFQADRLIQLFESQNMREKIISTHHLIDYYELDTTALDWKHDLKKAYYEDISFKRTKFISVELSVNTKSADLSSAIATTLINYIDTIRKDILFENVYTLQKNIEQRVLNKQMTVDSLLFDLANASEPAKPNRLAQNIISNIEENRRNGKFGLGDEIIQNAAANHYTYAISKQINEYYTQAEILSNLKRELVQLNEKTNVPFPRVYKVTMPEADYKKTSPSFLINTLLGLIVGAVMMLFYYIISIRLKNLFLELKSE
ncbi:MAG: Wzz/FepE/Etk N-terminal domain-containing protein [Flavobacteriales bacterium]